MKPSRTAQLHHWTTFDIHLIHSIELKKQKVDKIATNHPG
jgi:hypothetical protein